MTDLTAVHWPSLHDRWPAGAAVETPRLVLRPPEEADFDGWSALLTHPDSARFLGGPVSRAQAWAALATVVGHWQLRGFGHFAVILKSSDECVGWAGPWFPEGWPGQEVGWALRREYWGQGLAHEATLAALQWVRSELHWPAVIHCIHPENKSSIALATRIGSRFLRITKSAVARPPENCDRYIYGQDLTSTS